MISVRDAKHVLQHKLEYLESIDMRCACGWELPPPILFPDRCYVDDLKGHDGGWFP